MDNRITKGLSEKKCVSVMQEDVKQEPSDSFISKKSVRRPAFTSDELDEKDLLISQLQEQIAKQRECISYYESIVQLMNYRLMKLKKVLKAHQLLEELD